MQLIILILVLFSTPLFAQELRGIVIDSETKEIIVGASIYLPDLHTGTITDSSGKFHIREQLSENHNLQCSATGYKTQLINVISSQQFIQIVMEPSHIQLQELVVCVPKGKLQTDHIVLVDKKEMAELQFLAAPTLSDALTSISGVDQITSSAGIGKPVIRGLSGNRIVIYAQDLRLENQQWGDEHGLGIGEVGIEGVEVIKGPSSLMYGSDALGGVLYLVEERYALQNSMETSIQSLYHHNDHSYHHTAAWKINKNRLKFNVFGNLNSSIDYQVPGKLRVFNSRYNERSIKTAMGYASGNWIGNIRYQFGLNKYGITEDSLLTTDVHRNPELPNQKVTQHLLTLSNQFYLKKAQLHWILGYGNNGRKEFEDDVDIAALSMQLNTWTSNLKWTQTIWNNRVNWILGHQAMFQTNTNSGEEALIPNSNLRDFGLYSIFNMRQGSWTMQGGARLDYRNVKCDALYEGTELKFKDLDRNFIHPTFSFGAVYSKEPFSLRMNLSNGFRSPNTSELSSNGKHEGTNRYEIGNGTLKAEHAYQMDISMDFQNEHLQLSFNPFFNRMNQYIYLSPTGDMIDQSPVYQFLQTNANLYGGEFGIHYHPHPIHWLHLESEISTVFGSDLQGQPLPFMPAPRINNTIRVETESIVREIFLQHMYKFPQNRIHPFESPTASYHILHAGLRFEKNLWNYPIQIHFVIRNILNHSYQDHLSRLKSIGLDAQGINFVLGVRLGFSHVFKK